MYARAMAIRKLRAEGTIFLSLYYSLFLPHSGQNFERLTVPQEQTH